MNANKETAPTPLSLTIAGLDSGITAAESAMSRLGVKLMPLRSTAKGMTGTPIKSADDASSATIRMLKEFIERINKLTDSIQTCLDDVEC